MTRLLLFITILCYFANPSFSQSSKKRADLEKLKRVAQEQIEETNRLLTKNKKTTLQSLNQLNILGQEIQSRKTLIETMNEEISLIEKEQRSIEREIDVLSTSLKEKKSKYAMAMRGLYEKRSGVDNLLFILSAQTVSQSYRRARYLQEYAQWRKLQAKEITEKQDELNQKNIALSRKKAMRQSLLDERKKETLILQKKEGTQKQLIAELKKKQKSLQSDLRKQQLQAQNLDKQIQRLIEEEARKAAKQKNTKAATKGGYAMNKQEVALSGSFEKNKGRLPYPITGPFLVVGHFGKQQHADLKYVVTNNNGIDIQGKPGAEARAVFDGVVSRVFIVPGYNSSVIIRHGNYLTVYSNMSKVYVKSGDKVKTNQSIGQIYTDSEDGNQTKMQFQLWKETKKLDPEPWLRR